MWRQGPIHELNNDVLRCMYKPTTTIFSLLIVVNGGGQEERSVPCAKQCYVVMWLEEDYSAMYVEYRCTAFSQPNTPHCLHGIWVIFQRGRGSPLNLRWPLLFFEAYILKKEKNIMWLHIRSTALGCFTQKQAELPHERQQVKKTWVQHIHPLWHPDRFQSQAC